MPTEICLRGKRMSVFTCATIFPAVARRCDSGFTATNRLFTNTESLNNGPVARILHTAKIIQQSPASPH